LLRLSELWIERAGHPEQQAAQAVRHHSAHALLAREILYRPKQGFAVLLAGWFRGPLRQRLRDTLFGPVLGGRHRKNGSAAHAGSTGHAVISAGCGAVSGSPPLSTWRRSASIIDSVHKAAL